MSNKKCLSLANFKAYQKFREMYPKICTRENIKDFVDYGKIVTAYTSKIGHYVTESSEGVWIEDLGYFGAVNLNVKYRDRRPIGNDDEFNWETKGNIFALWFIHKTHEDQSFKTFTFDYTFSKKVRKRFQQKLLSGGYYNLNTTMLFKQWREKN